MSLNDDSVRLHAHQYDTSKIKVKGPITSGLRMFAKPEYDGQPLLIDTPYLRVNFEPNFNDSIDVNGFLKDQNKYAITLGFGYEDQRTQEVQNFHKMMLDIQDEIFQQVQAKKDKWKKPIVEPTMIRKSAKVNESTGQKYPDTLQVKIQKYGVFKDQGFYVYKSSNDKDADQITDQFEKEKLIRDIKGREVALILQADNIGVKDGKVSISLLIVQIVIKAKKTVTSCLLPGVTVKSPELNDDTVQKVQDQVNNIKLKESDDEKDNENQNSDDDEKNNENQKQEIADTTDNTDNADTQESQNTDSNLKSKNFKTTNRGKKSKQNT